MHLVIGTGKVGVPLSRLFEASKIPALSTSRSGNVPTPLTGVAFDWTDKSTFEDPFSLAEAESDVIQSIFMTPPKVIDMLDQMRPFIDFAAKIKGVKRFVLLSASIIPPGEIAHGAVHKYLADLGVEYAAIRPSWFFQNFYALPSRLFYTDLMNNSVVSSTGSSKLGFVDARDIADAAFHAMTDNVPLNGSCIVFGPELLSYAEVAASFSSVTGRTITHRDLSRSEFKERAMRLLSLPEPYAEAMALGEDQIKNGVEEKFFHDGVIDSEDKEKKEIWFGKISIQHYFQENKEDLFLR
ncbi:hypothetical protein J3R30DRAFT_2165793 [Lentinula aciculospora]|uniref:NmrA-like domain-containing protein n=1 Tax=Lentinula aciculospora TaxID=153920 RepID=A0A9W9DRV1_9AGAR|nr:hypothetical protein J3R30DRAFT_2165793 [Lentinula aciculospora]